MGIFVVCASQWFCWTALLFSSCSGPSLASGLDRDRAERGRMGAPAAQRWCVARLVRQPGPDASTHQASALLLTLEPAPSGVPLNLTLLLWPEGAGSSSAHQPPAGEPEKRIVQCFTRLDPDNGVFGTGSFSRGRCTAPPGPSSMPSSGSCMSNAVIAWCCFGMVRGNWIGLC